MSLQEAKNEALAIKGILAEAGISNASIDKFLADADDLPDSRVIDQYNELATTYNNAQGEAMIQAGDELVDFYHAHAQELSDRRPFIDALEKAQEQNKQLKLHHERLLAQLEDM